MISFCNQVAHPEEVAASKSLVSTSFLRFRQQPASIITSVITCVYIQYCNLAAQQLIYNNSKSLVQRQLLVAANTCVAESLHLGRSCQRRFSRAGASCFDSIYFRNGAWVHLDSYIILKIIAFGVQKTSCEIVKATHTLKKQTSGVEF